MLWLPKVYSFSFSFYVGVWRWTTQSYSVLKLDLLSLKVNIIIHLSKMAIVIGKAHGHYQKYSFRNFNSINSFSWVNRLQKHHNNSRVGVVIKWSTGTNTKGVKLINILLNLCVQFYKTQSLQPWRQLCLACA